MTRSFRYYDLIMAAFVTILLCSNIIGTQKVTSLWGFEFGAGILFFPLSYIFGDILTEVYGYARARKVVWAGFAALAFASVMAWIIVSLPPSADFRNQQAVEAIFGGTPRIALASLIAFFCGEFCNSYTLAKMKVLTKGKALWSRTIGSTVVGELVDSIIFYPLAFFGTWETSTIVLVMTHNYLLKVLWEALFTPATYRVIAYLKRVEQEDYYDIKTKFTPFSLKID